MLKVVNIDKLDVEDWRKYVSQNKFGNIFQTPDMYRVFDIDKNNRSLGVALLDDDSIRGLVIGTLTNYYGVASRLSIQGGPLFDKVEFATILLSALENLYGRFHLTGLFDIKNMWETGDLKPSLEKLDFSYEDHLNYIIDIKETPEETWSSIPRNRRKNIRRAMKKDFVISDISTRVDVLTSHRLIENTYRRVNMPAPDVQVFTNAIRLLKGSIIGKNLYSNDRPIATRIFLAHRDVIYDWYAGSLYDEESEFCNELLVWSILEYGSLHGYRSFDFGGAGHPNKPYGPREFKKRFGGKLVNYGKYMKIKNGQFFKFFKKVAAIKYRGIEAQI